MKYPRLKFFLTVIGIFQSLVFTWDPTNYHDKCKNYDEYVQPVYLSNLINNTINLK